MAQTLVPLRSYSGKIGCMCGCLGTYQDDPKKVMKAFNRIIKRKDVKYDKANKAYYYETKTRNNVVYMKEVTL